MPFGQILKSRLVIAIVMSFFGDSDDVHFLMKRISHSSKACFDRANAFKGFLTPGITKDLKDAEKAGKFIELTKF